MRMSTIVPVSMIVMLAACGSSAPDASASTAPTRTSAQAKQAQVPPPPMVKADPAKSVPTPPPASGKEEPAKPVTFAPPPAPTSASSIIAKRQYECAGGSKVIVAFHADGLNADIGIAGGKTTRITTADRKSPMKGGGWSFSGDLGARDSTVSSPTGLSSSACRA